MTTPQGYCHTIQFRGSAQPTSRYQLKIFEVGVNGQLQYRAQWDFPTLKHLLAFLKKYFPTSQVLAPVGQSSFGFETILSAIGNHQLKVA